MKSQFTMRRGQKNLEKVLLLFYSVPESVPTIEGNIAFYQKYSNYRIDVLNLSEHRPDSGYLKIPKHISLSKYDAIIIHNTIAYDDRNLWSLDEILSEKLKSFQGVKIILKQDEHYRFHYFAEFVENLAPDYIFTVMPMSEWPKTYGKLLPNIPLRPMLTGYILPEQRQAPDFHKKRPIDIGYRGSIMPLSFGRLCYDKRHIGDEIIKRLKGTDLRLDISSSWKDRIGSAKWIEFLTDCKSVLGVESGAGVFELDNSLEGVRQKIEEELGDDDGSENYAEAYLARLAEVDGKIQYYTISPRHFEAIIAGAVQILLPGYYSGRMIAGRHYYELARDYSNLEGAIELLRDEDARVQMAKCAFEEVVLDSRNWIEKLVSDLDHALEEGFCEKKISRVHGSAGSAFGECSEAAFHIVVAQAHEYGIDPRRDHWYQAGAPKGMNFHSLSVSDGETEILEKGSRLLLSIKKRWWKKFSLDHLDLELASDTRGTIALRELRFLDYASTLTDKALFQVFGIPQDEVGISKFRWYLKYILNTSVTLVDALSNVQNIHGIVAINLPTLIPAVIIGRLYEIPVIYEALEYWPEVDPSQSASIYHFFKNAESRISPLADIHGTVSPQLAALMSEEFGSKFYCLPNVVPLSDAVTSSNDSKSDSNLHTLPGPEHIRFLFQGTYARDRGLEALIDCWAEAPSYAHLYLRGSKNSFSENLKIMALDNECLNKNIHFIDPVSCDELIAAAHGSADVGIIPYPPFGKNYTYCSPNKMGQYFAAGLPILANNSYFVREVVNASNSGFVVDFTRRNELLEKIELLCDPKVRSRHATNARAYFEKVFNWEAQSSEFYNRISDSIKVANLSPGPFRMSIEEPGSLELSNDCSSPMWQELWEVIKKRLPGKIRNFSIYSFLVFCFLCMPIGFQNHNWVLFLRRLSRKLRQRRKN